MRWLAALLILIGLTSVPLAAQEAVPNAPAPAVMVRESADPATGAVVGQHVALYVDVLFRGEMPRPPRVSLPDVPGLQAFRFETQGVTMRESIAGEAYVGQRFEFALYPRRGGPFEIPPAAVTLLDREGDEMGSAQGQILHLDVTVPPGVDVSQPVVATRRLTLDEQWTPMPTGRFKAGDAVVRTITRSAEDVPGLAMRDLAFPAPEGVRVYADPPDITDHANRGVVTGRRVDRVTYVFTHGGPFVLPAVAQPWWDLGARSLKTAEAPAVTIQVAAAAAPSATGADRHWTLRNLGLLAASLAGLVVLALGAWFLRPRLRARRADPERKAFAALRRACAGADASIIYRLFRLWTASLPPMQRPEAYMAANRLQAALFVPERPTWTRQDSNRLLADLETLRERRPPANTMLALPPLNPPSPSGLGGTAEQGLSR